MVNRASTVRKFLFLLFATLALLPPRIHIPGVLGVSINMHAWEGSTDFSERATLGLPLRGLQGQGSLV